jgi:hypothetical protein
MNYLAPGAVQSNPILRFGCDTSVVGFRSLRLFGYGSGNKLAGLHKVIVISTECNGTCISALVNATRNLQQSAT